MSSSTMTSQTQQLSSLEHYDISKKLSSSKYSVYQGFNEKLEQQVALKFFDFHGVTDKNYRNQISILSQLDHPHIIKLIENVDEVSAVLERKQKQSSYIAFEFAENGDLFEIVSKYGAMSEILCRTLFHQLVDAIEHMHSNGVAHLDLKLENLLFDKDFNLKVTDFDLSQSLDSTTLIARGTAGYRAPEIKKGLCYNLKAADVYSLAIVLFILFNGSPPYAEIQRAMGLEFDGLYKLLMRNNTKFWALHSQYKGNPQYYSQDFKDLINAMLLEEPSQRLTLEEIKQTKWFQGPVLDQQAYDAEIKKYTSK